MAILCCPMIGDLKKRVERIIVAYNRSGEPVTAGQLKARGVAALLKDASTEWFRPGPYACLHSWRSFCILPMVQSVMATKWH